MKTNRVIWVGYGALVAIAGFAWAEDDPKQAPATKPAEARPARSVSSPTKRITGDGFPVIGYIEKRNRTITIKAGPKGPLYSLTTSAGKVLFENVPAEQLRAQAPELSEFLKTAVASGAGSKPDARVRVITDASLRDLRR